MHIYVRSRDTIKRQLTQGKFLGLEFPKEAGIKEFLKNTLIISINGYTFWDKQYREPSPVPIELIETGNVLVLNFDDATPESNDYLYTDTDGLAVRSKYKLFSREDAKSIIDFLNKRLTEDIQNIVVHCTAGISRSGAVGEVLNDYYNKFLEPNKEHWEEFYLKNCERHIDPNPHVSSILRRELLMETPYEIVN